MAATERDGYTPKARELDLKEMEGSIKALTVEHGDFIILRLHEPDHDTVRSACDMLDKAMSMCDLKGRSTALVMDSRHDIERIPYDIAKRLLSDLVEKHERLERERQAQPSNEENSDEP